MWGVMENLLPGECGRRGDSNGTVSFPLCSLHLSRQLASRMYLVLVMRMWTEQGRGREDEGKERGQREN